MGVHGEEGWAKWELCPGNGLTGRGGSRAGSVGALPRGGAGGFLMPEAWRWRQCLTSLSCKLDKWPGLSPLYPWLLGGRGGVANARDLKPRSPQSPPRLRPPTAKTRRSFCAGTSAASPPRCAATCSTTVGTAPTRRTAASVRRACGAAGGREPKPGPGRLRGGDPLSVPHRPQADQLCHQRQHLRG